MPASTRMLCVALLSSLLTSVPAWAQNPPPELTEILALPVSVGSTAMLVRVAGNQPAQMKLSAALKNADPDIRTVAARVVTATASRGLLPDVRTQLASESDPIATTELARTLATLGDATDDVQLLTAAKRGGADTAKAVAEALGRVRPDSLESLAPDLAQNAGSAIGIRLAVAAFQHSEFVERLAVAAQRAGLNAWRGFLSQRPGGRNDPSVNPQVQPCL